jgi:hypothetical protein
MSPRADRAASSVFALAGSGIAVIFLAIAGVIFRSRGRDAGWHSPRSGLDHRPLGHGRALPAWPVRRGRSLPGVPDSNDSNSHYDPPDGRRLPPPDYPFDAS